MRTGYCERNVFPKFMAIITCYLNTVAGEIWRLKEGISLFVMYMLLIMICRVVLSVPAFVCVHA